MAVRKEAKEVSIKKTKNTVENINKVEKGLSYGSTANVMRSEAVASAKKNYEMEHGRIIQLRVQNQV